MEKEDIIKVVGEYLSNECMKYAIMINGAWGVGKTHLYFNDLRPVIYRTEIPKSKPRKDVYISLYGMSSIDELARSVFYKYVNWNPQNNGGSEMGEFWFGIADAIIRSTSIKIKNNTIDLDEMITKLYTLTKTERLVVCFDDFERCTIPLNVLLGYINNLIEHCDCKVIILADESNLGKLYANTNLELKYQTMLSGGRRISMDCDSEDDEGNDDVLSIDDLRKQTIKTFSENYLYSDVKEKVVGRTYYYFPNLKQSINEVFNKCYKSIDEKGEEIESYGKFLTDRVDIISDVFSKLRHSNLRTVIYWANIFECIYQSLEPKKSRLNHYDEIARQLIQYSILVEVEITTNKQIGRDRYTSQNGMYYLEDGDDDYPYKIDVIDELFIRNADTSTEIDKAIYDLERKIESKNANPKKQKKSSGEWLGKLRAWKAMDRDSDVSNAIARMIEELDEKKYVFDDFFRIVYLVCAFNKLGICSYDINVIKDKMISQIKNDDEECSTERAKVKCESVPIEECRPIFLSLIEEREERNAVISKYRGSEFGIYSKAERFDEYCKENSMKFFTHRSFTQYVNVDGIFKLIRLSRNKDIYTIMKVLRDIYFMDNVLEIYSSDIEDLVYLRDKIIEDIHANDKIETVRKIALEELVKVIEDILERMGID